MEPEKLRHAGLTENQSQIYIQLIKEGQATVGTLSKKTKIHRRNIYDALEALIKKGLASYIKQNKTKIYKAAPPERLLKIIKEKEQQISSVIEDLKKQYIQVKEKQETTFFKGKEGLKTIFEDQLNSKEILIIGASPKAYEILEFYFHWYDKKRKKKKIKTKIISNQKLKNKIPFSEIKYLPKKYSNPVSLNIYQDKTAIILWTSEPIAILIKNNEIAQGYKKYFELMWKISKPL